MRRRPKAYAHDKNGRELHIRHAAADLGVSETEALITFRKLEKAGLVRLEGKRIYLCAAEPKGGVQ